MSAVIDTKAGEIGELAGGAVREMVEDATVGAIISTYADGTSPLSWDAIQEGGWDLVGLREDAGGAELRDLVAIAQAWGGRLVPLPYLETVLAKRHSEAARVSDGAITFALPLATLRTQERSYVPFGAIEGVGLATGLGAGHDSIVAVPTGSPDTLDIAARGIEISGKPTEFSDEAAREIAVVYAASAVGATRRLLELGVEFAKERQQFGKPIGSFQAVKHQLADVLIDVESAETAVIWASVTTDQAMRGAAFAVRRCLDAADRVLQVHGGLGFTWEMGLHFYLRHILASQEVVSGLRQSKQDC